MIRRLFLSHPEAVGETYGQHLVHASRYGFTLMGAGVACFLHALVPALHRDTASGVVMDLSDELRARRARAS